MHFLQILKETVIFQTCLKTIALHKITANYENNGNLQD